MFFDRLSADSSILSASGMFGRAVAAADDIQSRLLARLGRDPSWRSQH